MVIKHVNANQLMFHIIMTTSTFISSSVIYFRGNIMKESSKWRITVTSSSNETFTDPLGNKVGGEGGEALFRPPLTPFYSRLLGRYLKTT